MYELKPEYYQNKAIRVSLKNAEFVRKMLLECELIDRSRKIQVKEINNERILELPVRGDVEGSITIEQDEPEHYCQKISLKDRLDGELKEHELQLLPSGWQIIGNIIIVNIPGKIWDKKHLIAACLLDMYPNCKTVIQDHGIKGQYRIPDREIIAGSCTETVHKENGCLFKMDVTKVMFSKGNMAERTLMSAYGDDETIVDMFAGIGYFTIPIATHANPEKIIAIEMNPIAHEYPLENIKLNHAENIVESRYGDCMDVTPEGIADRVIMGYVGTTHNYLKPAINAVKSEGGTLHYHETVPEDLMYERPFERIENAAREIGRCAEILEMRKIKKYSPGVWHVVVDAAIKD